MSPGRKARPSARNRRPLSRMVRKAPQPSSRGMSRNGPHTNESNVSRALMSESTVVAFLTPRVVRGVVVFLFFGDSGWLCWLPCVPLWLRKTTRFRGIGHNGLALGYYRTKCCVGD